MAPILLRTYTHTVTKVHVVLGTRLIKNEWVMMLISGFGSVYCRFNTFGTSMFTGWVLWGSWAIIRVFFFFCCLNHAF